MAFEFIDDTPKGRYEEIPPATASTGGASGSWQPSLSRTDRLVKGLRDPIDGGAQLLTKALPAGLVDAGNQLNNWLADKTGLVGRLPAGGVDQQVRQGEANYQASRAVAEPQSLSSLITGQQSPPGFDGYRVLGNVLSPANLALGASAPAAASLMGRVGVGAATGAVSAALNPVGSGDFTDEKIKQVGTGAAFGGALPLVTGAMGRIVSPNASTNPNLQLLRQEGVRPTIGQTLGGWANRMEEKAVSMPFVGDSISGARTQAQIDFNRAALNRATAPIGGRVSGAGQEAVRDAGDQIGGAYTAARAQMGAFQIDQQGAQEIQRIRAMVTNLPAQQQRTFNNTWNAVSTDISPNGTIPSSVFKRIDSRLGKDAADFSGATDPYHRQLGDALTALQTAVSDAGRRANPQADAMFTAADRAYANLVRIEGASKAAHNAEGVFTPGQLNMAIRQADQSVRGRAVSRGTALMQDLGNAGQQVLGNKVPNSGTTDRLMQLGAGGALVSNPALAVGGGLLGMGMYTSPMQSLLRGAVASRPQSAQAVRDALLQASPGLLPGAAQIGLGLLN